MGGCSSCLRLLLNEADVKIHVIEPTSVMGGADNTESIAVQPSASTLQVPPLNRPRTPSDHTASATTTTTDGEKTAEEEEKKDEGDTENAQQTELDPPVETLQIPEVRTIPVKPKMSPFDSVE